SPDFSRSGLAGAVLLAQRVTRLGSPPLYVHFAHKPATLGRFAARLAGVPYGLSAHAKDVWLTEPRELKAKASDATVVLTCTEEARAYVDGLVRGAKKVRGSYRGVEAARRFAVMERSGTPVVLVVARLVEKKGVDLLIRASARVRADGTEFAVRIAGEGPEWARLQRLAHELGVADRV